MPRKTDGEAPISAAARPGHDAIVALTEAFCREHLSDGEANLATSRQDHAA